MSQNKNLYIADLDGTLLNQSAKLSEYTVNFLNALISKGINFSVATARQPSSVSKMLTGVNINVPAVLMNGALIYDIRKQQYVKVNKLEKNVVQLVIKEMKNFKISGFMYELKNEDMLIYHEIFEHAAVNDYIKDRASRYHSPCPTNGLSEVESDSIIYFSLVGSEEKVKTMYEKLKEFSDIEQTCYKNVYEENIWFLEIFSTKANKKNAVNFLREEYSYEKVICFGDNSNDLPMFEASDVKVAVGNAILEVKEMADYVCDTNENDGVVKWIEKNQ